MGKGSTKETTQTSALDPASQAFVDQQRRQAQEAAGVATGTPGDFFLGADPRSVQEIISPFQNQFTSQVIDATRAEFENLRGGARRDVASAATSAGAFGGSRQGVAEGVRLGELDRAQTSQIAGLLSSGFDRAVSAGIPFADRQRQLAQQQAQEPLFRQQQAQRFLNLGLGPTGQTTTTTEEQSGNLFGDIAGAGLAIGGLLTGGAAPAAAAGLSGLGTIGQRRDPQFVQPPFNPGGIIPPPTNIPRPRRF